MDYQALYRKYRPQRFDEVVGQQHVTRTLAREVVDGRVAHAYLFAGPRGTGKTTTARLLAKSLNCADRGPDGEPDNTCASCVAITAGSSMDVIELDAASHNKVEDVREIRINVGTVAAGAGSRRIYILDEAHMLSRAAGNALLKTLEEPPDHVVFVLATTEPYKLLDTIRSRSQRFDFHPVGAEHIVEHLEAIAGREEIDTDPAALAMIAGHARGSVRDAMSLLEQVAALGETEVGPTVVTRALGLADRDAFAKLAGAIDANDAPAALGLVAELASRGADLRRFVAEAVEFFRGVFLAQYAPNLEEVVDDPPDDLDQWRRHAAAMPSAEVLRSIDLLGDALLQLRQGREERLVIEITLLKLTRPETAIDPASLADRLDRLESRVRDLARHGPASPPRVAPPASGETVSPGDRGDTTGARPSGASEEPTGDPAGAPPAGEIDPGAESGTGSEPDDPPEAPPDVAAEAGDIEIGALQTAWPALVARVRETAGPVRHALVKVAEPIAMVDGVARLEIPGHLSFHLERLRADTDLHDRMTDLAAELLGARIGIEWVGGDPAPPGEPERPQRAPDKDDLVEGDDGPSDPTDMVVDLLGGEIVSD